MPHATSSFFNNLEQFPWEQPDCPPRGDFHDLHQQEPHSSTNQVRCWQQRPSCSCKASLHLPLLSDFCPLRGSPTVPFPGLSELKAILLQPSLTREPKFSLQAFNGTVWFPPSYLLSPGYPALAALQALPAHPTLCRAGAAPGWEAQQLHRPSLAS